MKIFEYTPYKGVKYHVSFSWGKYNNNQTSLQLIDYKNGDLVATASICVPGVSLKENEIIIKNYSENEGILDFLVRTHIVELTDKAVELGLVEAPIVKLNPETIWIGYSTPNP